VEGGLFAVYFRYDGGAIGAFIQDHVQQFEVYFKNAAGGISRQIKLSNYAAGSAIWITFAPGDNSTSLLATLELFKNAQGGIREGGDTAPGSISGSIYIKY
jgi:hypothetical protein